MFMSIKAIKDAVWFSGECCRGLRGELTQELASWASIRRDANFRAEARRQLASKQGLRVPSVRVSEMTLPRGKTRQHRQAVANPVPIEFIKSFSQSSGLISMQSVYGKETWGNFRETGERINEPSHQSCRTGQWGFMMNRPRSFKSVTRGGLLRSDGLTEIYNRNSVMWDINWRVVPW